MKSCNFLNWKFCGSNHVGSDHTGSTTIIKEDISLHSYQLPPKILFLSRKKYLSLQQSSFPFSNWTFLVEIFIQTFLFQRSVLIFKGVFKEYLQFAFPPLPESDSAFSKTLTPVPSFNLQCSHARMNFLGHFVTLCILFNKTWTQPV